MRLTTDEALLLSEGTMEHYEMTRYGSLIAYAEELGRGDCTNALRQTLEEGDG